MNDQIPSANSPDITPSPERKLKRGAERRQVQVDRREYTDDELKYLDRRVRFDRNGDDRKSSSHRRGGVERRQDLPQAGLNSYDQHSVSAQSAQPQIIIKTALAEITINGCDVNVSIDGCPVLTLDSSHLLTLLNRLTS